jgi:hypothetical protein
VSGGGELITGFGDGIAISEATTDRSAWFVIGVNNSGINGTIAAIAYCAGSNQAVAAKHTSGRARREVAARVARLQSQVDAASSGG